MGGEPNSALGAGDGGADERGESRGVERRDDSNDDCSDERDSVSGEAKPSIEDANGDATPGGDAIVGRRRKSNCCSVKKRRFSSGNCSISEFHALRRSEIHSGSRGWLAAMI